MSETAPLTFEKNDKLGLKPFSEKLEKFLIVEHNFIEGSLVVSLNAPFGAGKTYFLSMWKSDVDKRRETDSALLGKKEANWWFWVYLTGSGRDECKDAASIEQLIRELEFVSADYKFDVERELGGYSQGWGNSWGGDRWQQIYQKIETATSF